MKIIDKKDNYIIYNGSMLDMLTVIEPNSIDSIVCDPPYHLKSITERFGKESSAPTKYGEDGSFSRLSKGFMNQTWDGGDIAFQPDTWRKCYDALKDGGYLLAFGGSRTFHRMAVAIEDAGFEIRDTIMWLYGSGFPKSHNIGLSVDKKQGHSNRGHRVATASRFHPDGTLEPNGEKLEKYEAKSELGKQWQGWGTALKPAYEPIIVARKPFKTTVAENIMENGVGGINIDECRVDYNGEIPNVGGRANHTRGDGYGFKALKEDIQANNLGRFPANVIHDGSEEAISGFPDSESQKSVVSNKGSIWGSGNNDMRNAGFNDSGSASRYFYCAKASKKDRDEGLEISLQKVNDGRKIEIDNPFQRGETLRKNIHPTVKPCELMQYLVRLVSPKNATILDPFMGSGSTGKAVMFENRERKANYKFIGIDLEKEYCNIASARIDYAFNKHEYDIVQEKQEVEKTGQLSLF